MLLLLADAADTATAIESGGRVLSAILGWASTIHSVDGLSLDFVYLNVQGFLAYSIYNVSLFTSDYVREEYRERNNGHSPSVRGNDVAFAIHALAISILTLGQTFVYELSQVSAFFIAVTSIGVAVGTVIAAFNGLNWLDLLYYLSYLKLVISFWKFVPQAWLNYTRKSTIGWSIYNILLDFSGGACSLAQLLLDARLNKDWGSIRGNPAKLILGLLAMSFDTLFMVQHYILYRHSNSADMEGKGSSTEEADPLGVQGEADERTPFV